MNIPDFIDLDRIRHYAPKNALDTPPYYPQKPPVILDNPSTFEKFDIDTLFFIFYYQQRTLQQYFAQLYAHTDVDADPASAGRQMNGHYATRMLDERGAFKGKIILEES